MAQQGVDDDPQSDQQDQQSRPPESADPLDSGLRRKFLNYCEENPSADECRIYDT